MNQLIEQHREVILRISKEHGVTDVRVFGSMARGTADGSRDVDFPVRQLSGISLFDFQ